MPSRIARLFVCCLLLVASSTDVSAAPQPGPLHDEAVVRMLASGRDARPLAAQASADDAQSRARALALREQPPGPSVRVAEAAAAVADAAGSINGGKAHPAALEAALDRLAVADRLLRAGYPMHAESPIALALGLRETLQQRAADTVARWDSALRPLLAAGKALRGTPNAKAASLQLERQLAEVLLSDSRAKTSPNLQLPVHRPGLAPPALSDGNSITPSYADPRDPLPLDEDLLASGEVQFTQPVLQKAQQLGYRYVDLFDFVRSSVRTEWSAGSTQSPERSLRRLAGNDVEQASLLIALLRASGAAARYVHGVVEVPASDLAQQMGVPQAQLGRALTLAGIAHRPRLSAGRVVAYQIRHTWVSARVPYGNYRGSVADTSEPTWIPLMPALKPAAFQAGTSVLERVPQDMRAWLQAYLAGTQGELPWPQLRQRWVSALAALQPPVELAALAGQHEIDAPPIGLLPSSTPYPVVAVHGEFGVLPDELRQRLRVRLTDPRQPQAAPLLEAQLPLGDLSSHRFTLAFLPATVEDQHMTNANGSLGAFPLNLIRLRPSLMSEGLAARPGRGEVIGGTSLELEIELATPNGSLRSRHLVHAGSIAGFAIDAHGDGVREPETTGSSSGIPLGGLILSRFAETYLAAWANAESESAAVMGLRVLRPAPALAIALPAVTPLGAAGFAESLDFRGVVLDAALRPLEPVALNARPGLESDWLRLTALHGSALESQAFEDHWAVRAVSADRLLQQAQDVVNLQPGGSLDSLSAHPEAVRQQIAHWLAQGKHVQMPRAPQTVEAWTGSAWRVHDIDTGESGYFLSGGYAGGATSVPPGLWYFQELAATLADPYAELPNEDPNAAALIQLDAASEFQRAQANRVLDRPLRVHVLDVTGRPVVGARVRFERRAGGARIEEAGGAGGSLHQVDSNRRGQAQIRLRMPRTGEGLQEILVRTLDEEGVETAYLTEIDVSVGGGDGALRSGRPFSAYMTSGPVAELALLNAVGTNTAQWVSPIWTPDQSGITDVFPHMGRYTMNVEAKDEFGNRVGGAEVALSAVDSYQPECLNQPNPEGIPLLPSRLYDWQECPSEPLLLPEHPCAAPAIAERTNSQGRRSVTLVPTNLILSSIRVRAESSGVLAERQFRTLRLLDGVPAGDYCLQTMGRTLDPDSFLLVEFGYDWRAQVARPAQAFPQPRRFAALRLRPFQARAQYLPVTDIFGPSAGAGFMIEGGSASPGRQIGEGMYEFDLIAGEQPGEVRPYIQMSANGSVTRTFSLQRSWAVQLPELEIRDSVIALDEFGRSKASFTLNANIQPEDYQSPDGVYFGIEGPDGRVVFSCFRSFVRSARQCEVPRGTDFSRPGAYRAYYALNPNTANSLQSEPVELAFSRGIVAAYGSLQPGLPLPELDTLLGDRFPRLIEIRTEIDTQTDYICQTGNRFMFALGTPARVDLEFFALDENGARGASALLALSNAAYEAGVFEEELALGRLPFGAYEFELRARTDDEDEVHVGRLIHREKRRGALALGRSLVKGVDVHDGHAVISAEDIAIGGRGPGLRFTRTYNSHAGNDETVLGRGWHSDLDAQLVPDSCGSYVVTGAAGQGQRYVPDGIHADGSPRFRSGNGFHGTLRRVAGSGTAFDFFSKDGTRYHFAERDVGGLRLSYVEDTSGNRVSYEYSRTNAGLLVTRAVDGAGRALNFNYETKRLERAVLGVPAVEYRTLLASIAGPGSLRVEYAYAGDGTLERVVRSGAGDGRRDEQYTYRDFGGLWLRQSGAHRYYHMGFRLTEARDAVLNSARRYTWQVGWSGLQLPDGSVYPIPEMRVETLSETDGGTVRFSYSGLRPLQPTETTVIDARSHASTYTMNRYGATERLVAPAGTTLTEWDFEHLQPRAITDPLGTRTAWTFDTHGNRLTETVTHSAGSLSRRWTYVSPDAFAVPIKDRVRTATDARGTLTTYAYDGRGRRTGQTRGGVTEVYAYAANGDLSSYTDGAGALVTYGYDAYGYRSSESDDLGPRLSASFDALGRKLSERNGEGDEIVYTYDALDRVRRITHAEGSRSIDYEGRIRTERDELGNATVFEHDAQGRLLRQRDAAGGERVMTYDNNGNLLSESDFRGNVTTHSYNAANHRTRTDAPLQRATVYTHNALGQVLTQRTEGGASEPRETRFEYAHPLNLVTLERQRISDEAWAETRSAYDNNGNLERRTDPEGRLTVQVFDLRDRLIRIETPSPRSSAAGASTCADSKPATPTPPARAGSRRSTSPSG